MAGAPEERRWQIGLIGCGRMGRVHAERLRQTGCVDLTVVYDPVPSAADHLCAALAPDAVRADSADAVTRHPGLDAVVICSPTHQHVEQVAAAVAADLHILCEKPLADTAAGLAQLLALAGNSSRHLVLAYQRRFWGTYRTLAREVRSGRWGAIRAVTSHNTERWQQTIAGTWRDDPRMNPGGFFGDAGSHKLDALFYVTGLAPQEVFARARHAGSQVEVLVSLSALLTGDVPLTMDFIGSAEHFEEDLTIHCDGADLLIRDWRIWVARRNEVRPLEPLEPTTDPATGFIDALASRMANPAPFSVAQPVFDLTAMALESARTGAVVRCG